MSEFDCTKFVYSSSATVYGTPPVIPIPESTRLKADSPYGKSKVMCETIVEDLVNCTSVGFLGMWRPVLMRFFLGDIADPQRWRAISLRYFK